MLQKKNEGHLTTRKLVFLALMVAMNVVLGRLSIQFTQEIRISIVGFLPIAMAAYKELEDSYPLDTVDDRISAREYARITVQAEQAFQAFQSGDAEALKQYNTLLDRRQKISNDSQFTKKTRPKEVVDENDLLLGMLAKRLEAEGLLLRPTRAFPQDELDALIEETRHLAACLGDGGSV